MPQDPEPFTPDRVRVRFGTRLVFLDADLLGPFAVIPCDRFDAIDRGTYGIADVERGDVFIIGLSSVVARKMARELFDRFGAISKAYARVQCAKIYIGWLLAEAERTK